MLCSIFKTIEDEATASGLRIRNIFLDVFQSISAAEDEKSAIKDMVEEGINLELEALQELIDKYNDSLDSAKDLYDYQKKTAEQTKEISSLQKQLSAYAGDNSEETKAKIQELKTSLEEAQDNLKDSEYDRYVSDQKELLDSVYTEYEEVLNSRLDNIDALIQDMIDYSNENASTISDTIREQANDVGYTVSQSITDIWSSDSALSTYTNGVRTSLNNVNTALNTIKNNMQNMVTEINNNANRSMGILPDYGFFKQGGNTSHKGDASMDIENNLIQRMRFFGIDSSYGAYYWEQSGLKAKYKEDWKGYQNVEQNKALLEWMKANGYARGHYSIDDDELAWTQENGAEAIIRPSDGAILTPLVKGDSILNADATANLYKLAVDPSKFIESKLESITTSIPYLSNNGSTNNEISLEINLPNVTNYEQFKYAMQHDKQFEKLIQSMVADPMLGKSSLGKFKIKQ